jgi:PAS domain S-box-containing protein
MDIQGKTNKELLSDFQSLLKENNSLKALKKTLAKELKIANKEIAFHHKEKEKWEIEHKKFEAFSNSDRRSSQYARSLIEASLDPLVTISLEGKITDINKASIKVTGVSRKKLIGTDFFDYSTEPEKARYGYKQVFDKGFVSDFPLTIHHQNGKLTDVLFNASVYKDDKGKALGIFAAARDVTAQKKASQYARSLIEASLDPLVTISLEGKITDINKALIKVTGVSRKKLIGTDFSDYFIEPEKAREGYKKVFEKGFVSNYPLTIRHKNGKLTDVLYNASVYKDNKGRVIGVFAAARDITAKKAKELTIANKELLFQNEEKEKRAEELIIAKERAEESDRLKSAFLANMSHEIRTPMNGILGFAELLKEPGLTGETQREYISIIEKSGQRMLNILNDIVSLSKIESGLMDVNIKETDINQQIVFIHSFFKLEIERKGIRFLIKKSLNGKKALIQSDSEKIYGILTNIVKNAIKFTRKGTIELGYRLKTKKESSELEFYVKDTGIGIPKDRQKSIFDRFIQADISGEMAYQGAGLGLSISKAYVELLGGKIWVESEEGKGSTFYFTLPYRIEPKDWSEKYNENDDPEVLGLKILIAEDDDISGMLLSFMVKSCSKKVFRARTGVEAVDIFHNNPDIDLILMDMQMPKLNGDEATRQIRQFNKEVIIIAQTGLILSTDDESVIDAGFNACISKPINKRKLLGLIQKYFKK